MKRFNVVIPRTDGGIEMYPMKEWLRQHPEHLPPGLNPTSNSSHQLRNGLRRLGWSVQETPTEVRMLMPGTAGFETAIDAVIGGEHEEAESRVPDMSFTLEYQLRDFIAQNLTAITVQDKRLQLYVDPTGRDGIEFSTAVGLIDILAVDEAGAFVVFELKRARSHDEAIGQLTRYMGWVKHTIGKGREVRGVIVAKTITNSLRYAASVIQNVSLFEYEVDFRLKPAHEVPSKENIKS